MMEYYRAAMRSDPSAQPVKTLLMKEQPESC